MTDYGYVQPLCDENWLVWADPYREPVRVLHSPTEVCCLCGQPTDSGIYVRVNPDVVPFSTLLHDP